jgi:hypothetical protein
VVADQRDLFLDAAVGVVPDLDPVRQIARHLG